MSTAGKTSVSPEAIKATGSGNATLSRAMQFADAPPRLRFAHGAVAVTTIASMTFPVPALATRHKFESAERGILLAEEEPLAALDIFEEAHAFQTSFNLNSTEIKNSGIVYRLDNGAVTVRQLRTEKTNSIEPSGETAKSRSFDPSKSRYLTRSAASPGLTLLFRESIETAVSEKGELAHSLSVFDGEVSADALRDAQTFYELTRDLTWTPQIWNDDGEIVFEWIESDRHAVVSIEGDGTLGYAVLRDGQFLPGQQKNAPVGTMPIDLKEYLAATA